MDSPSASKEAYIDALRGFAVCGVVATHCSQPAPAVFYGLRLLDYAGGCGVQLFFMLSALTLCLSWYKRVELEQSPVRNFYLRRFFRIAPLFYLAMASYLLLNGIAPSEWTPTGIHWYHIVMPTLFLHGFSPGTFNVPVPGSWSIAVEMFFYLLLPLLIVLTRTLTKTLGILVLCIIISRLSPGFVMSVYGNSGYSFFQLDEFRIYNFLSQLPFFIFGISAFHLLQKDIPASKLAKIGISTLVLLGIPFFLLPSLSFHHLLGGALSANLAVLLARWPVRLLVNPLSRILGTLSYSIYLSHFAVISLLEKIGAAHWIAQPDLANLGFFVMALALSALVSLGLHHGIETPFIRMGSRLIGRLSSR